MKRALQYLVEPGDESLVRSWSGIVFGACLIGLPVLFGVMDVRTCLIASVTGAIPALLFWRQLGEPWNKPIPIVAGITVLGLGIMGIARNFGFLAWFSYMGGLLIVLSVMRVVTHWRDPLGAPPQPEWSPEPASRPLVWLAIVLPLLLLVGVIVLGIAQERGAFR